MMEVEKMSEDEFAYMFDLLPEEMQIEVLEKMEELLAKAAAE